MADNSILRALGIIGDQLPKWWRDINPPSVLEPTVMGGVGGPRRAGYAAVSNPDITPGDVLETGASIPGGLVAMLLGYSPDADAAKGGVAKGGSGAATKTVNALKKKLGFDFENPGFDRAKMGRQYPENAPPVMKTDPRTGKVFPGKALTAEGEAVQRAVAAAQREIDAGRYTPYFDVEKRAYVDASKYPLQGRAVTDAMPKKAETAAQYRETWDTPEARQRLSAGYEAAKDDPLAKDWYAMQQLEAEFIDELGEVEGRRMFKERFADAMAATTGGADPTANLRSAAYMNYLRANGLPTPKNAYDVPYPVGGGKYGVMGNLQMYDKIINQGVGLDAASQPKRFNFSANFQGHRDRATIDEQMSGGFKEGLTAPPGMTYGTFESIVHDLATKYGVDPANFQDVTWAGLKQTKGKPMIQQVNEAIERTSRVTGKSPRDALRQNFIRAQGPVYGMGGGVAVNEAMQDDRNRR